MIESIAQFIPKRNIVDPRNLGQQNAIIILIKTAATIYYVSKRILLCEHVHDFFSAHITLNRK